MSTHSLWISAQIEKLDIMIADMDHRIQSMRSDLEEAQKEEYPINEKVIYLNSRRAMILLYEDMLSAARQAKTKHARFDTELKKALAVTAEEKIVE